MPTHNGVLHAPQKIKPVRDTVTLARSALPAHLLKYPAAQGSVIARAQPSNHSILDSPASVCSKTIAVTLHHPRLSVPVGASYLQPHKYRTTVLYIIIHHETGICIVTPTCMYNTAVAISSPASSWRSLALRRQQLVFVLQLRTTRLLVGGRVCKCATTTRSVSQRVGKTEIVCNRSWIGGETRLRPRCTWI